MNRSARFKSGWRVATWLVCSILLAVSAVGCEKRTIYPVSGQVVDTDGNPITELKGGAIAFELVDGKSSSTGAIDENASFRLGTVTPGDGAILGTNRVLITLPDLGPEARVPPVILKKYEQYETSGLEVVVEPKNNVIEIKVERVKR